METITELIKEKLIPVIKNDLKNNYVPDMVFQGTGNWNGFNRIIKKLTTDNPYNIKSDNLEDYYHDELWDLYEIRNDEIIRDYECLVIDLFEGHSELIKEIFIEGMIDKIKEEIINDIKHFEYTV